MRALLVPAIVSGCAADGDDVDELPPTPCHPSRGAGLVELMTGCRAIIEFLRRGAPMPPLVAMVLASGCAANAEIDPGPCPPGTVDFVAPALDATVPPPSADIRMMVSDSSTIAVDLDDDARRYYFAAGPGSLDAQRVYSVHFAMLPPSTAFTVNVSRACPTDNMHIVRVMVANWRFRTGP